MFSRLDQVIVYKTSLNKFKATEITQSKLSDHNGVHLETTNKFQKLKKKNHRYMEMLNVKVASLTEEGTFPCDKN